MYVTPENKVRLLSFTRKDNLRMLAKQCTLRSQKLTSSIYITDFPKGLGGLILPHELN